MDPVRDLLLTLVRDAFLPIFGRNTSPAIVLMPQSPASITMIGLASDSVAEFQTLSRMVSEVLPLRR